jgi:hypothetical protein
MFKGELMNRYAHRPPAAQTAEFPRLTGSPQPPRDSRGRLRAASTTIAVGVLSAALGVGALPAASAADPAPDFGPNVIVFDPSQSVEEINATLASIANEEEFSLNRHAVFFKPGTYGAATHENDSDPATDIVNAEVGYYTTIAGLGSSPNDVLINGALHVEPVRASESAPWEAQSPGSLTRFWRSMSNIAFNPIQRPVGVDADRPFPSGVTDPHQMRWAVSQAAPLRRVHVEGDLTVFGRVGEYASGGYMANSVVDGDAITGSQQQWFTRDSTVGSWGDPVWNTVLSGVEGAPADSFPDLPTTTLPSTDVSRDAPFLTIDDAGNYSVFAPAVKRDVTGADWGTTAGDGRSIPISDFYLAHPGDSAATINAALDAGKDLLITPGVYELSAPIHVSDPNTVVLGLGMATLIPTTGAAAITVDDVSGVQLSGVTVDAGAVESPTLIEIGDDGSAASHANNPTTLTDVFVRVGGPHLGKAEVSFEINSDDVLLDDIWAWRADHGAGAAWDQNTADTGVVVNGDDVTALGLFVEHYQKNQVIWNGERGTTIFFQSEMPYDVPNQAGWMDGSRKGFAAYRVADSVSSHHAVGLGVYSYFNQGQEIVAESGVQAPRSRDVTFESLTSVMLNGKGQIAHIINDEGEAATVSGQAKHLADYAPVDTTAPVASVNASKSAPDGNAGWYRGVSIDPRATDDFLPAPTVRYRLDGGSWQAANGVVAIPDGEHSVQVRATDDSGNDSALVSWSGKVDQTAPVLTANVTGAGTAGAAVSLQGTDATSGLAAVEYSLAGGAWTAYSSPVTVPTGTAVVSFRATDVAGNVSPTGSASATGLTMTPSAVRITGAAKAGATLHARTGSWGTAKVALHYQWLNDGKAIRGATKATYKLRASDVGDRVSVRVTGTAAGLPDASVTSAGVKVYRALKHSPKPRISGTAKVGHKLTAVAGSWGPKVHLSYRWYRDGKAIPGADEKRYTVKKADRGDRITVSVTGKRIGYLTETEVSSAKRVK